MRVILGILVALAALGARPTATAAEVRRVVLVTGNNVGLGDDVPLKYAERDADRVAEVFRELGKADHVETVLGADATRVLEALQRLQRRVAAWKKAGARVQFLFYYSGHGTERGLRMGGTELSTDALLTGMTLIGADVRLLVVDACESGTFTRIKGVRSKRAATVEFLDRLDTRGEVFLASTSRGEAAQESENLKGSFFTSYWLTGLRGAADANGDGAVSLHEAYAYAYDRTVVSTVLTATGLQHPTFSSRLAGRRDLQLTWPRASGAQLRFRARTAGAFLVLSRAEDVVLAEVPATGGSSARIGLPPGTYVIKKRGTDGLYVAMVELRRGVDAELDEAEMRRIPYAVLVTKGAPDAQWMTLSGGGGTTLLASGGTVDLEAGYQRAFGDWIGWAYLGTSTGRNEVDGAVLSEGHLGLGVLRREPRPSWEVLYGARGAAPLYVQQVLGQRRTSIGLGLEAVAVVAVRITDRADLTVRLGVGGRLLRAEGSTAMDSGWAWFWKESLQAGLRVRL